LIGEVKDVYLDIEKVQWKGGQPYFIEVELVDEILIAKPSQLKLKMI
jgi:hypothetical protein